MRWAPLALFILGVTSGRALADAVAASDESAAPETSSASTGSEPAEPTSEQASMRFSYGASLLFTSAGPRQLAPIELLWAPRTLAWWPSLRFSTTWTRPEGAAFGIDVDVGLTSTAKGNIFVGEREYLTRATALLYADLPLPQPAHTFVLENGLRLGAGLRLDGQAGLRQLHLAGTGRFLPIADVGVAVGPRASMALDGVTVVVDSFVGARFDGVYGGGGLGILVPFGD